MSENVTPPTPTLTLWQQVFTLSILSNYAASKIGSAADLASAAASSINIMLDNVANQIGQWEIIWGPVVFESGPAGDPSTVADNTMVVFQRTFGSDAPLIVVAIAGTNPYSLFGFLDEDAVGPDPVTFSNDAWISAGTSTGLQALETMQDPKNLGPLQPFLESKASSDTTLVFAGHSLGGALSPTLALDLVVNKGFLQANWANVFVYPSAGPTPGNQAFRQLFAQTFPPVQPAANAPPFNAWNMDITNSLDVVPRAWSELSSLPGLYAPNIPARSVPQLQAIVNQLSSAENLAANQYAPLPTSSFAGTFQRFEPAFLAGPFPHYLVQAVHQHIQAYLTVIIPSMTIFPVPSGES